MKQKQLNKLSNLLVLTRNSLWRYEANDNNLNFNLKYWKENKIIIRLKRGLYVLRSQWSQEKDKQMYLEYLANQIYQPSYISGEYVMNKYNLLTETVFGITSMTTKTTKNYINELGNFSYSSLSVDLFCGFTVKKFRSAYVFVATKEKAVFDYLYLRFLRRSPINKEFVNQLRINWENMTKKEFAKLTFYAKKSRSKRIFQVIKLIKEIRNND